MIKIVNKNKYEKMIDKLNKLEMENYDLRKVAEELNDDNDALYSIKLAREKSIGELNNELLQTNNENVYLGTQIDDLKKIIRKLKTLCTKNKIDYSKIFEKGEK